MSIRLKRITSLIKLFRYRRKAAVEDLAVKPVTQFPVEIDNEVNDLFSLSFTSSFITSPACTFCSFSTSLYDSFHHHHRHPYPFSRSALLLTLSTINRFHHFPRINNENLVSPSRHCDDPIMAKFLCFILVHFSLSYSSPFFSFCFLSRPHRTYLRHSRMCALSVLKR